MRASHILVSTLEEAQSLRDQIVAGHNFGDLARQHSKCPSGQNDGDLGEFGRGQMVPSFEMAVLSLPIDGLSSPLQTQFGYHLIKRTA